MITRFPASWKRLKRLDRGITEAVCPHGVGHPEIIGSGDDGVHGCDGCCSKYILKSLDEIEARAFRVGDKKILKLAKDLRSLDEKIKRTSFEGDGVPEVGQDVYVPTQLYIDRGEDDIRGGLAEVKAVRPNQFRQGDTSLELVEFPGSSYHWNYLKGLQAELKKEFGNQRAKPDPDYG